MQMKIFLNQILFCQFGRNLAITRCAPSWLQCTEEAVSADCWSDLGVIDKNSFLESINHKYSTVLF